jgi:hypothetical protein
MDGQGVRTIAELAAAASVAKPFVIEGAGYKRLAHCREINSEDGIPAREWSFETLPCATPAADPLLVHTLTGFADHVTANRDGHTLSDLIVSVVDPTRVVLVGKVHGEIPQHDVFLVARFEELIRGTSTAYVAVHTREITFDFGTWMRPDAFNVALQCLFQETEGRATVLEVVGNLKCEGVTAYEDDGVTQGVVASAGIRLGRLVAVPNPVTLTPWRTFREIDQPESKFVLRVKGDPDQIPEIALFEADGGAWRLEAIERIAAFLRPRIPTEVVIVA